MNYIFIPGNSIQNKEWIYQVSDEFKIFATDTLVFEFNHWATGENLIDINIESKRLAAQISDFSSYVIFAKSAGCLLTLKLISEQLISPEYCFFVGFPVNWANQNNFDINIWIKNYSTPTLFLQKTEDTVCSSKELHEYLTSNNVTNHKQVEIPGNNHHYADLNTLSYAWKCFLSER